MRVRAATLPFLLAVLLWLSLAAVVSAATRRVADWFVMTDELLYERLALSIARTHSPFPRVHTEVVSNVNQLYPLLIAPAFRGPEGIVQGLHNAHVLNAFVMCSATIPAYLLARRVTSTAWPPLLVAAATVAVPWITLSSFLLTEVAAYPAFVWAVLAMQGSVARPSARNDLLAVLGLGLAVLARTQFYALAIVLPIAIVAEGVVARRLRATLRAHVVLLTVYAAAGLAAIALEISGHSVLGLYSQTASGNPLPLDVLGSAPAHLAIVALGSGILPFVVGGAWIVSNLRGTEQTERRTFAFVAAISVLVLTLEVASFNVRFGGGLVRERYLFYVTPLFFTAFAAALTQRRWPRWSIAAPLVILAIGFWRAPLPVFEKLNVDTPVSILDNWLVDTLGGVNGARVFLVLAAVVVALVYIEAAELLPRPALAIAMSAVLLTALVAETTYAFDRLFRVNGTSGLPLTLDQSPVFSWVDRTITTNSEAVMVPYPVIRHDYWANAGFWWDLEFWNKSVDREAARPNQFSVTPAGSFPTIDLKFDSETGKANYDVDSYVAQAMADSRFHIKGRAVTAERGVSIVFPERPWRADWVSYGLYPDGWTRPGATGRIRVFADAKQDGAVTRTLTLTLLAPDDVAARDLTITSNAGRWNAKVGRTPVQQAITVCVPARGHVDVVLRANASSTIYGDPSTAETVSIPRDAGVLVDQIALSQQFGARCTTP